VVAERDGVGAGVDEFLIDRFGDAEAPGRVLAVDDGEIELPLGDQLRPTMSPMKRIRISRPAAIDHFMLG
jgi:hypothetical protein